MIKEVNLLQKIKNKITTETESFKAPYFSHIMVLVYPVPNIERRMDHSKEKMFLHFCSFCFSQKNKIHGSAFGKLSLGIRRLPSVYFLFFHQRQSRLTTPQACPYLEIKIILYSLINKGKPEELITLHLAEEPSNTKYVEFLVGCHPAQQYTSDCELSTWAWGIICGPFPLYSQAGRTVVL